MSGRCNCAIRRFERLESRLLLTGIPELVADINTQPASLSRFREPVVLGETLFFTADGDETGVELWKTVGTSGGTVLVKDIREGIDGSYPEHLTVADGQLFFIVADQELWKSNGTEEGTVLVKELVDGPGNGEIEELVEFNDKLFFGARDERGRRLWMSDGTAEGTNPVDDEPGSSRGNMPHSLTEFDDHLYYLHAVRSNNQSLFRTDGNSPPELVAMRAGDKLIAFQDELLLAHGFGIRRVTNNDLVPVALYNDFPVPHDVEQVVVGDRLFYTGHASGFGLWQMDSTLQDPQPVEIPGVTDPIPLNLTNVGGKLYFTLYTEESGEEWWSTDGTQTQRIADINPGPGDATPTFFSLHGIAVDDTLLFNADDGQHGVELWKTNGSETQLVADIASGPASSNPSHFVEYQGMVYFSANDQVWKTDGDTLQPLISANRTASANPAEFASIGDTLYFTAYTAERGTELWKSDGTAEGTSLLLEVADGINSSHIRNLTVVGDEVYFISTDLMTNHVLWKTDGTVNGSEALIEFPRTSVPQRLTATDSKLFFRLATALPVGNSWELWVSDGSSDGTRVMNNELIAINNLTATGDELFFTASGDFRTFGNELFKTDGTEAGTVLVKDIFPGDDDSAPILLSRVGDEMYFFANSSRETSRKFELWKSDGTEDGTTPIRIQAEDNVCFRLSACEPTWIEAADDGAYFTFYDSVSNPDDFLESPGFELWKTDGTTQGTHLVKDIYPGSTSSSPDNPVMLEGILYFTANDGNGRELWRSDGSDAGTFALTDQFGAGKGIVQIDWLTGVGDRLYFMGDDGQSGRELWTSDGTAAGTMLVADLRPGVAGSDPDGLHNANGRLYFTADNGESGREVWQLRRRVVGDLDGDGDVDSADRTIFTQNWTGGQQMDVGKTPEQGDLDGDGDVDSADLTILVQNWTGALDRASKRAAASPSPHPTVAQEHSDEVFANDDTVDKILTPPLAFWLA